ncbi:MAG TPA: glycosyltransferase [Limnobacter sp.]|nr:glycosyltransferase [Limnobacter sp.]
MNPFAFETLHPLMQSALVERNGGAVLDQPCCLLLSVSDGHRRAVVRHWLGEHFEAAWARMLSQAPTMAKGLAHDALHVRVECVVDAQAMHWCDLKKLFASTKRNYFTQGIALGTGFEHVFLSQELNANAMLYGSNQTETVQLHEENFNRYGRQKYGKQFALKHGDTSPVVVFNTVGFYWSPHERVPWPLHVAGVRAGSRLTKPLDPHACAQVIASSSEFLARQVNEAGRFVYGIFPCFDREVPSYNALRHASTTYAMLEAWELTRSEALWAAIERALAHLTGQLVRVLTLPGSAVPDQAAFLVDTGDEIKLGGNAVCILALCKYTELTGDRRHLTLLKKLAFGIGAMFNPETGQFVHVLHYPSLQVKEAFRIIYYDGEAAFALMRLYRIARFPLYLQIVERAFDHFIGAGHDEIHDHWLSYCVNELTMHRPERKYFEFGIRNFAEHLDFVLERITTFPTLLELMMAAEQMLQRMRATPELHDLLATVNLDKFYHAMHHRANYLLSGYFWPEWAMYFKNPQRIVGSFFIRHHAFRVRIDDVEHYLSGLVAYRKFLLERQPIQAVALPSQEKEWHGTRVWFLNQDMGFQRSGVENASLMRANLFVSQLQKPVTLLCSKYNPELAASTAQLRQLGQLHPGVQVCSVYDWVQSLVGHAALCEPFEPAPGNGLVRRPVQGTPDFKWFNQDGAVVRYEVRSQHTGRLLQVNHFLNGQKVCKERFDSRGFKSQVQELSPQTGNVLKETYLYSNGRVALEKFFGRQQDEIALDHIRRFDAAGELRAVYRSEEDLLIAVLQECVGAGDTSHLLVVDKNRVFYKAACMARRALGNRGRVRLVSFVHNLHTQALDDVQSSALNSNYSPVFDPRFPCDAVCVSTEGQAKDIRQRFVAPRVFAVPQAYTPRVAAQPFEARNRFRLVMMARIGQEKRMDLALQAFALVCKRVPLASLDVYGYASSGQAYVRQIHRLVESLGLQNKVSFKGWASEPALEYERAGLCLLSSEKEGFALSLMEATRHGCPVVAFNVRYGPADIVVQGQNGYLVPFGDLSAMADAIVAVLQDESMHRALSDAARRLGERFSADAVAGEWRKLLAALGYATAGGVA